MTLTPAGNSSICALNPASLEEAEFQQAMLKIAVEKHGYCEGDALLKTLFEKRSNGEYSVEWVNGARQGWLAHIGCTQPNATNEGRQSTYAAAWAAIDDLAHRPEIMDMSLPDAIRALVAYAGGQDAARWRAVERALRVESDVDEDSNQRWACVGMPEGQLNVPWAPHYTGVAEAIDAYIKCSDSSSAKRGGREPIGYVQPEPNLERPDRRIVVVPDGTPLGTALYLK